MVITGYNRYPYRVQLDGHDTYWPAHHWCFRNIEKGVWSSDYEKPNTFKFTLEEDYNLFVSVWMEQMSKTISNDWYTVEFPVNRENRGYCTERLKWCFETFGQSTLYNGNWHCYTDYNVIVYEFKNEEDATLFKLRWL